MIKCAQKRNEAPFYMVKHQTLKIEQTQEIKISASYVSIDKNSPENVNEPHVHPECEIYINLGGDVSFMVEGRIYPVVKGNIVISKPYEYHHCVYHSDELHSHYWFLISAPESKSAEVLFRKFFNRKSGENNLLALPYEKEKELFDIAHSLTAKDIGECEKYANVFKLLALIDSAEPVPQGNVYSAEISKAVSFIDKNFSSPTLTVEDIAEHCALSVNTLERHFRKSLSISPISYLKKKRLGYGAKLLSLGKTVSESCELSGFSDYSYFISLFKKNFGVTPLKYKKQFIQ